MEQSKIIDTLETYQLAKVEDFEKSYMIQDLLSVANKKQGK